MLYNMSRVAYTSLMIPTTIAERVWALKERITREGVRSIPGAPDDVEITNGLVVDAAVTALMKAMDKKAKR